MQISRWHGNSQRAHSDSALMDKLEALVREKVQSGESGEDAALEEDDEFEIKDFDDGEI